jgi:hypothetical protein
MLRVVSREYAGRTLQASGPLFHGPKVVQHQSAATAPAETSVHPTQYEPLTCASDLHRPLCLQMVRRRSESPSRPVVPVAADVSCSSGRSSSSSTAVRRCDPGELTAACHLIEPVEQFMQCVTGDNLLPVRLRYDRLPPAAPGPDHDAGVRLAEPGQAHYLIGLVGHQP